LGFGINTKTKNFLIFQGDVTNISCKKPNELTIMFEELSGSIAFKKNYEDLKVQKNKIDEERKVLEERKRLIKTDKDA
jgi:structural maintenance of chromosome 1